MTRPTLITRHPFDEALTLTPVAPGAHESERSAHGHFEARPHPAYANMVGPFGGVTAAQALAPVLAHPQRLGEPLALTVNFAAPVLDAPLRLEARPVRTNRSTQHWAVTLQQTDAQGVDAVVATATAVTAARRETWSATDAPMPDVPPPAEVPRDRFGARGPAWVRRYDLRPLAGALPAEWDGREADSHSRLWLRDDPPRPLDFLSLAAMADVFFPRVWRRRARMTPVGTVSMTVYFHASAAELAATGEQYLLGQARAQSFFNGFFDQSAELWNPAGHLLATTHQIVYYKE